MDECIIASDMCSKAVISFLRSLTEHCSGGECFISSVLSKARAYAKTISKAGPGMTTSKQPPAELIKMINAANNAAMSLILLRCKCDCDCEYGYICGGRNLLNDHYCSVLRACWDGPFFTKWDNTEQEETFGYDIPWETDQLLRIMDGDVSCSCGNGCPIASIGANKAEHIELPLCCKSAEGLPPSNLNVMLHILDTALDFADDYLTKALANSSFSDKPRTVYEPFKNLEATLVQRAERAYKASVKKRASFKKALNSAIDKIIVRKNQT